MHVAASFPVGLRPTRVSHFLAPSGTRSFPSRYFGAFTPNCASDARDDSPRHRSRPQRRHRCNSAQEDALGSLVPETLEDMKTDVEFQQVQKKLQRVGQRQLTREERMARQRSLDALGVCNFASTLKARPGRSVSRVNDGV